MVHAGTVAGIDDCADALIATPNDATAIAQARRADEWLIDADWVAH
jgi:hypothetical protein